MPYHLSWTHKAAVPSDEVIKQYFPDSICCFCGERKIGLDIEKKRFHVLKEHELNLWKLGQLSGKNENYIIYFMFEKIIFDTLQIK